MNNRKCSHCGKEIEAENGYYCAKCGKTMCSNCYDGGYGLCDGCSSYMVPFQ